ncbi:MAG: TlpA disulfide reductase family protein [Bacteroidales bacterium]|nr:TlpA family protein disulfide reductase [Bacteroidales bacterium]MDD2424612.1 TlpA disulfide reductase family protein [Bacteroidales bacterium]MDD3988714.1 TlpA disulfide reductase family protein [Bacteroidales bacterium]
MYTNFNWSVKELIMESENDNFTCKFSIPDKCSFIALKLLQGNSDSPDAIDNNSDNGYFINPLDEKGRELPGAGIAQALFENPSLGTFWMNYYKNPDRQPNTQILNTLIAKEKKIKGSDPKYYIKEYADILKLAKGDEGNIILKELINKMLKKESLSEKQYMTIERISRYAINDTSLANKVISKVLSKYPGGSSARQLSFQGVMKNINRIEDIIDGYENFLKAFPVSEWRSNGEKGQSFIYYTTYRTLSAAYFDTKQYDKFMGLLPDYDFKTLNEVFRWNITRAYVFKKISCDSLEKITTPMIKDLISKVGDGSFASEGFNGSQIRDHASEQLNDRLTTYISILYDLKRYQEAKEYFKYISDSGKLSNPERNEMYTRILEITDIKSVLPFLEKCMAANAASPFMLTRIGEIYKETHPDMQGYDAYLESFKTDSEKDEIRKFVTSQMLNVKISPFELEDLNGNIIKSDDWAGKIVVIDFWATWCKPCINALPGMQIVVDKYANDTKVDFYFVGTMQSGNYKEKTISFIKKEGFRLNFLLDRVNPDSGDQSLVFRKFAERFNSSGIPRKVILKDGYLRYSSEGYSGSASMLADEISYAIELLKAE